MSHKEQVAAVSLAVEFAYAHLYIVQPFDNFFMPSLILLRTVYTVRTNLIKEKVHHARGGVDRVTKYRYTGWF
jgi:hypothetical protein